MFYADEGELADAREDWLREFADATFDLLDSAPTDVGGVPIPGSPVVVAQVRGRLVSSNTPREQESAGGRVEEVRQYEVRLSFAMRRAGANADQPTDIRASQQIRNAATGQTYEVAGTDADRAERLYLSVWVIIAK